MFKIIKKSELNDLIAERMDFERQLIRTKEELNKCKIDYKKKWKNFCNSNAEHEITLQNKIINIEYEKEQLEERVHNYEEVINNLLEENEELRRGQEALLKTDNNTPKKRGRKKKEEKDAL